MCTYCYIGKHKAAALFTDVPGGPFGLDTFDDMSWHYQGGGLQLLNEFYQQVLKMDIVAWPIFPTKFLHSFRAASRSFRRPA